MVRRNDDLTAARMRRADEFLTRPETVEAELGRYREDFTGRPVVCPANDWTDRGPSAFVRFLMDRMADWRIPELIAVHYHADADTLFPTGTGRLYRLINDGRDGPYTERDFTMLPLDGTGGFDTPAAEALLDTPDVIVATNPPFSRFRRFMGLLDRHRTDFLILGNLNAALTEPLWSMILAGRVWLGVSIHAGDRPFDVPADYPGARDGTLRVTGVRWYTSLPAGLADKNRRTFTARYSPDRHPRFDMIDAIDVDRVADIPVDWPGLMGVPITFLDSWAPGDPFDLIGKLDHGTGPADPAQPIIDGRQRYKRLLIRRSNGTPLPSGPHISSGDGSRSATPIS